MATDSTELTFVRCPSCRSLVPAVSTRCRMCGATLDASQARPEESEVKRSGRVRQRTMSQPESDFMSTAEKVREAMSEPTQDSAGIAAEQNGSHEDSHSLTAGGAEADIQADDSAHEIQTDMEADPLSAYIEEVPVEESESVAGSQEAQQSPSAGQPADERFPWEMLDEEAAEPISAAPSSEAKQALQTTAETAAKASAEAVPAADMNGAVEQNVAEQQAETAAAETSPRVIVESGSRRGNRPSGLSFGKPRHEGGHHPDKSSHHDRRAAEQRHAQHGAEQRKGQHSSHEPGRSQDQGRHKARQGEQQVRSDHGRDDRRDRGRVDTKPANAVRVHESPSGGRLVGWFVHFRNPNGSAHEIREGKFFVTQTSLKERDMILDHESISTPHALIVVSASDGVRIQDLMSDRGVYLKRRGSDSYQRLTETTVVEHGEWVRFGDVEYLVSLVPYVEGGS